MYAPMGAMAVDMTTVIKAAWAAVALYVGGIAGNVSDWNAVDCDAVDGNGALDDPVPSVRGLMLTGATITATKGATGAGAAGHGSIHAVYYVPPAGTVIVIR